MSKANVDRFVEVTEAFNRIAAAADAATAKAVSDYLRLLDPEIEFEPQHATLQGSYTGLKGVRGWLADIAEHYGPGHIRYADIHDLGDRVLGLGVLHVTGKGSGIEIEVPVANLATFRNGLITHLKDYGDKNQALEAVGLRE